MLNPTLGDSIQWFLQRALEFIYCHFHLFENKENKPTKNKPQ